jgi:PhnB protein
LSTNDTAPFETSIAPWLSVGDAQAAVDFYTAAFGATESYRLEGEADTLEVARLAIGSAQFWVQRDPEAAIEAPTRAIRFILSVADPDATFADAVAAGAVVVTPVSEDHGWRTGRVVDPFGHEWEISRELG